MERGEAAGVTRRAWTSRSTSARLSAVRALPRSRYSSASRAKARICHRCVVSHFSVLEPLDEAVLDLPVRAAASGRGPWLWRMPPDADDASGRRLGTPTTTGCRPWACSIQPSDRNRFTARQAVRVETDHSFSAIVRMEGRRDQVPVAAPDLPPVVLGNLLVGGDGLDRPLVRSGRRCRRVAAHTSRHAAPTVVVTASAAASSVPPESPPTVVTPTTVGGVDAALGTPPPLGSLQVDDPQWRYPSQDCAGGHGVARAYEFGRPGRGTTATSRW